MGLLTDNGMYRRLMRDAFAEMAADYSNLRCYIADRYGETDPKENVLAWMKEKHAVFTEGVPEAERWEEMFWEGWHGLAKLIEEEEQEADEIIDAAYEEALTKGELWAIEAHAARAGQDQRGAEDDG